MTLCPSQGPCMAMVQPLWGGHGTTTVVLQQDGCDFTGTASSGNLAIFVRGLYDCPTNPQFRMFLFTENLALAARSWSGLRRMPVQGLCSASYDMSTAKGLKIFHITPLGFGASESVRKSHCSPLLPHRGRMKRRYGQSTGSKDTSKVNENGA